MNCKKCHNAVPDGSIFCNYCGIRLVKEHKPKDKKEKKIPEPRQLSSGKWFVQLRLDGVSYPITRSTYAEAKAEAAAIKHGVLEEKKHQHFTVGAIVDEYIKANENILSPSTLKAYRSYRKYRFSELMQKDVSSVGNWQEYINKELEKTAAYLKEDSDHVPDKLSAKTIINSWRLITAALRAKNIDIPVVNLPKQVKHEKDFLDYNQIQILLKACRGSESELAIILGLHSLRRSEIFALNVEDIDIENKIIHVNKVAVHNSAGEIVIKHTTKTDASTRDIPILTDRLIELVHGETGKLINHDLDWLYHQTNKICRENGLPEIGAHGLRHSFASLAYHLGWKELTTMQCGGWSNSDTIRNIYTHLSEKDKDKDIKKMKRFYKMSV